MLLNLNVMDYVYGKRTDEICMVTITYQRLEEIIRTLFTYFEECHCCPEICINYEIHECGVIIKTITGISVDLRINNPGIITIQVLYMKNVVMFGDVIHITDTSSRWVWGRPNGSHIDEFDISKVITNIEQKINEGCELVHDRIQEEAERSFKKISAKRVNAREL